MGDSGAQALASVGICEVANQVCAGFRSSPVASSFPSISQPIFQAASWVKSSA